MRYALISCIHGNLPAFEAVIRDAEHLRCDSMLCLGDIVGYFDQPVECLDLVRSQCKASVKGNYDEYCSESYSLDDFNPSAAKKIDWTREKLSVADRAWLSELPYQLDAGDFGIVHSSLCSPSQWNYVFDKIAAAKHFDHQTTSVCFNGHTHVPVVFQFDAHGVSGGTYTKFTIDPKIKYLVNVGSVGQPR
ncbi:MAG: yfcE, partial [Verrucomicrobiales bacterium]|nr:yfcE [Verrucomicrobiales bacterium]